MKLLRRLPRIGLFQVKPFQTEDKNLVFMKIVRLRRDLFVVKSIQKEPKNFVL